MLCYSVSQYVAIYIYIYIIRIDRDIAMLHNVSNIYLQ